MPISESSRVERDAFLYLGPRAPAGDFAQCSTCELYTGSSCSIMAQEDVPPTASCGLYVPGEPHEQPAMALVSGTEAGFVDRAVRCENCAFFDGSDSCDFFARLNAALPDIFALDERVDRHGCCNAQTPAVQKASVSTMKLYGAIEKVEPLDDGTVRVHGIASTEAVDDQGEVVKGDAIRRALPDYMKYPAVREMHQLSAAGTTLEADVGGDNITRIVAHVVDPVAVMKVKNQVYRGFSIGGRVTQREAGNPKTITGLVLNEISLVDRPANPESKFDCWKASDVTTATAAPFNPPVQIWACGNPDHRHLVKHEALKCVEAGPSEPVLNAAFNKGEVLKADDNSGAFADPGYQPDKKKRYKLNTEKQIRAAWSYIHMPKNRKFYSAEQLSHIESKIVSAWKSKIDKDGPPTADKAARTEWFRKALWNIGQLAMLCCQLQEYCEGMVVEAAVEGDGSGQPDKLKGIVSDLMQFLRDQVAEDTQETIDGTDLDEDDLMAEGWYLDPRALDAIGKVLGQTQNVDGVRLLSEIEKRGARHNRADQAMLDTVAYAVHKAMGAGTARRAPLVAMGEARKAILDAGAVEIGADGREMLTDGNPMQGAGAATQHSTVDTSKNPQTAVPNPTGAVPPIGKASIDMIATQKSGHVPLMCAAHDILCSLSDGATCSDADMGKASKRHSATDLAHMIKAHDLMMGVDGIQCAANPIPGGPPKPEGEAEGQGTVASNKASETKPEDDKIVKAIDDVLSKYLAPMAEAKTEQQPAAEDAVAKAMGPVQEALAALATKFDAVAADVQKIKETELPPAMVARPQGLHAVSKSAQLNHGMSNEEIVKALSGMTKEEQTIALIKAAKGAPLNIRGVTDGPRQE